MIIILNNSRILAFIFFILYALALFSVLISGIHWAIKVLLLLVIVSSLADMVCRHLLLSHKDSLIQLKLADNGVIKLIKTGKPEWLAAEIESLVIWPWLLMLKLKELSPQARTLKLLIARDAVSSEEFRKISQWLNQVKPVKTHKNQFQ